MYLGKSSLLAEIINTTFNSNRVLTKDDCKIILISHIILKSILYLEYIYGGGAIYLTGKSIFTNSPNCEFTNNDAGNLMCTLISVLIRFKRLFY